MKKVRIFLMSIIAMMFMVSCEKEVDANSADSCDSNCGKVVEQSKDYAVADLRSISVTIENNCNDKIRHKRIYTDDFISMHHFETHMYENYRIGKTVCEAYADWN